MAEFLISASCFNLLLYIVLVKLDEENLVSHRYAVGKWRSILILVSTCATFFFLYNNLKLKASRLNNLYKFIQW